MNATDAIASMREDIASLEKKGIVRPGFIKRRRAEVDALETELLALDGELMRMQGEAIDRQRERDHMAHVVEGFITWCRLWGIRDGAVESNGRIDYFDGATLAQLKGALAIRLEQFAQQGPAPVRRYSIGGNVYQLHADQPWLDGDWAQRANAVDAALSAAAIDRILQRIA